MLRLLLCPCRWSGIGRAKADGEDEYVWDSGLMTAQREGTDLFNFTFGEDYSYS